MKKGDPDGQAGRTWMDWQGSRGGDPRPALCLLALCLTTLALWAATAGATGPPQIEEAWVSSVTATSANLHAKANPEGLETGYRFEYIDEASYQANLSAEPPRDGFSGAATAPPGLPGSLGSGSGEVEAFQHLSGLLAHTAYRYRIVATNGAGSASGPTHAFTTQESTPLFALPDERGWEMVSPVDKNGGAIGGLGQDGGGDILQAAANGDSVTYSSATSFGPEAQGAPPASQYLSRREAGSWPTENITAPLLSASYGGKPDGAPYQLFSTDLARGLLLNGHHCRGEGEGCPVVNPPLSGTEAPPGYQNYYLRDDQDGSFVALLSGVPPLSAEDFNLAFAGASPDLRHVVLSSCAALTPEAIEVPGKEGGCDPESPNLYEWSAGALSLLNLAPGETQGSPGALLAAPSGAISADGSRVYWTQGGRLYLREGAQTKWVDESQGGGGSFQSASEDGSLAFFAKEGHLYRYQASDEEAIDLTPAGGVLGVLGASEDASYLYYATSSGLDLYHEGATVAIAAGAAAAAPSDYPPASATARISADGRHLAFLSKAPLTGYDNADSQSGEADSELFLYTAPPGGGEGTLICASCNPTGERPLGPSTIPGAIANGEDPTATRAYRPRALSADGHRLFFDSADALLPSDTNGAPDVYEWEAQGTGACQLPGGCLGPISSGRSGEGAAFADASADGSDAFFLTDGSLVPTDPGSVDLYDAREGGGFAVPSPPIPCLGDACQGLPDSPEDPTPGTLLSRTANPPIHFARAPHKKPHRKKHRHRRRRGSR